MFATLLLYIFVLALPAKLFLVFVVPFLAVFTVLVYVDKRVSSKPVTESCYPSEALYEWGTALVVVFGLMMAGLYTFIGVHL